jgi:uncharacterized protein (DUF3084 family)
MLDPRHILAVVGVLSCLSLGLSLYCLFFFIFPATRLRKRLRSLGGGLKGIEAHVDGVRDSISKRLDDATGELRDQLAAVRQETAGTLDRLSRESRQAQRDLEALRKEVLSLQADLRATSGQGRKLGHVVDAVSGRLQQLRSDLEARNAEMRQLVRQQVSDSFATVESTVLSALEAIQEEIIYGTSASPQAPPPVRSGPAVRGVTTRHTRGNIIAVGPLFPNLHRDEPEHEERHEDDSNHDSDDD